MCYVRLNLHFWGYGYTYKNPCAGWEKVLVDKCFINFMASIKYFRVYQLNKILWNWPQINTVIGLGQNLPLAFLDQSTCISQDQQFFPIRKNQLNGKLIFWLKRKSWDWKCIIPCDFYMWNWSGLLSHFHSWAAWGFALSQVRSPSLPSGPQVSAADTRTDKCQSHVFWVGALERWVLVEQLRFGGQKATATQRLCQAHEPFLGCTSGEQVFWVQPAVSPAHWGEGELAADDC